MARPLFAVVALAGLGLDVVTKLLAVDLLDPQNPVVLASGLLRLQLIRNSGAAFSLGENVTAVFAVLSLLVLLFVLVRLIPRVAHRGWAVALGLLSAGVAGNLSDRIFREPAPLRGRVVDFLQLPHWPIFNVADMCISSAAVFIVVLAIVKGVGLDGVVHTRQPRPAPAAGAQSPSNQSPSGQGSSGQSPDQQSPSEHTPAEQRSE
ncbi:signal peptidase II [Friedmanniella endophytica]|uniref:Lipoprotein signal peptidase n=1 Tax=Microlunatus kandeliicorticis TaxID=1759536 RepID=A0A7W3IS90_9ACTN|nr:signal peptidase II [Microlunatus kandeliicorticis]MBA8794301.1 signal peptidase II [Microlunatus kandeliicorticis]